MLCILCDFLFALHAGNFIHLISSYLRTCEDGISIFSLVNITIDKF